MSDFVVNVTNAGAANVVVANGSTVSTTVGNGGSVNVAIGGVSPGNATVVSGTLTINSTETLSAGTPAYAKNVGSVYAAKIDLGIPAGAFTNVLVGNTTTLAAGSNATVNGTQSGANLTLAFGIPRGQNGLTPSVSVGSVTTSEPGSTATVVATPSNNGASLTLNFTIPRGDPGANGTDGTIVTLSNATPANLGTAAAGSSTLVARADHVHQLPVIAYGNLSGVPGNFPTNTTLVSGLSAGYSSINHAHNYVTSLNNLTGGLTLVAGGNVTLAASGSTITLSAAGGGIGENDAVDGGDYVGQITASLTFVTQPQSQNLAITFSSWANAAVVTNVTRGISTSGYVQATDKFYIGSLDGGGLWYSSNLSVWQPINAPLSPAYATSIVSNGTRTIVAVTNPDANAQNAAYYTDDDTSWSPAITSSGQVAAIAYGAGRFVALQRLSGGYTDSTLSNPMLIKVLTSTDGVNWTQRALPDNYSSGISLSYGAGVFVATFTRSYDPWSGSGYPFNNTRYATSTDGINWTSRSLPGADGSYRPTSVAYGGGVHALVRYGASTNTVYTSTNGANWTARTLPASGQWNVIRYAAGKFILTSTLSTTDIVTSTDGITWTLGDLGASREWGVATGNSSTVFVPASNLALPGRFASATSATATLTVEATVPGGVPVSYQWQRSVDGGTSWSNVSNATSQTLSLTNITLSDSGTRYRVFATAAGVPSAYSSSALLTVSE